jgi:hypothetical protein
MRGRRRPNEPGTQRGGGRGDGGGNPWLYGAGALFAGSFLFGNGGVGDAFSLLPYVIVGGAVLGVVSVIKK